MTPYYLTKDIVINLQLRNLYYAIENSYHYSETEKEGMKQKIENVIKEYCNEH